ncbi:60S ribosomal protein L8-B [Corchorus olitorius]|uniref:60S ribosomal protein L8-B n=1 Tax=Corchorus olitorius TaxID=93759 RepID=A0A1R3KP79_9ROSI|nr:60S ribosomal protein L8-B [Corchorus olitorius]
MLKLRHNILSKKIQIRPNVATFAQLKNQSPIEGSGSESIGKGKGKAVDDSAPVNRKAELVQNFEKELIKETSDFQEDNLGLVAKLNVELSAKAVLFGEGRIGSKSRKIDTIPNLPNVRGDGDEAISKLKFGQDYGKMDGIEPNREHRGIGLDGKLVFQFQTAASHSNSAKRRKWKRKARVGGGRPSSNQDEETEWGDRVVAL